MELESEFDTKKALELLIDISYDRGYSIKQLSNGIYDYSKFNQICNGERNHSYKLLLKLCSKLELDPSILFSFTSSSELNQYLNLKKELSDYVLKGDYHYLNELLLKFKKYDDSSSFCFDFYVEVYCLYHIENGQINKAVEKINQYFMIREKNFKFRKKDYKYLNHKSIIVITCLAIAKFKDGNLEESLEIFDNICEECNIHNLDLYKFILYNRAQCLCMLEKYDQALDVLNRLMLIYQSTLNFRLIEKVINLIISIYNEKKLYNMVNYYSDILSMYLKMKSKLDFTVAGFD